MTAEPTICLCMIVKNEARVIERCLSSVRHLIDSWVISDTGSTDGTQDLIRRALADVPGELHEDPWVNFGHNRSLNIRHALGKADYLLLIDADMVVRKESDLPDLTADSYLLRHLGDLRYRVKRLVKADVDWRYEGATHEYLTTDSATTEANLDALAIEHFGDGGSRHDKFERDARLLSADLAADPGNVRTVFYLAQTMRDMGNAERAIELYERRAGMGGWAEEIYYSLLQVGILEADRGNWPIAMATFIRAWEARPQRLEACYELTCRLRVQGLHQAAHAFAQAGLGRPMPDDLLFVHPWVYRWGLLFEFSITAYWVGDPRSSLRACDDLLAIAELPENYRAQTIANRQFAVDRVAELTGRVD
ncbi:glycosyltransferase [Antrihabitans sp. YC2-6]|uniref:glycosyltransferase n=1 Tax=Antrihabitans sp. YC2-6 TaxID=2799498 RepID=UPI0018F37EB2|nr:glycosyltransferase [Antrihabitans sp. YC2-6]MBJ8348156.1 glycosyltransferase [Antrihabitans sp. YC2-6]